MRVVRVENQFKFEDGKAIENLLKECEDKEIIKSIENKDYHRLQRLENKAENKDFFGKKIFRYWQATRIREMDEALKPFFTVAASVKSQEKFIEVKELLKIKKTRVAYISPTSAFHRSSKIFPQKEKRSEHLQCFKKLCFGFFSIESRKSKCWFRLEKAVETLEVRLYDLNDHEQTDETNPADNKKNHVILRAKNTKSQTFTLEVGCYNIDINGKIFFIEVLA